MTDSITPNLGLTLPTVYPGDQWGGKLNANFSAIDLNAGVVTAEFTADAAKNLATVAALLADTTLAYVAGTGKVVVATSEIVEAGGFRYQVAASGASDQHVTTAGGVKLYVLPTDDGSAHYSQFNIVADDITDNGAAITALNAFIAENKPHTIVLPDGKVRTSVGIRNTTGANITSQGVCQLYPTGSDYAYLVGGGDAALNNISAVAANIAVGATSITFASAPALSRGDVFLVASKLSTNSSVGNPIWTLKEWFVCKSVSGTTVNVYTPARLAQTYTDDMMVSRIDCVGGTTENIEIVADDPPFSGSYPWAIVAAYQHTFKNFRSLRSASFVAISDLITFEDSILQGFDSGASVARGCGRVRFKRCEIRTGPTEPSGNSGFFEESPDEIIAEDCDWFGAISCVSSSDNTPGKTFVAKGGRVFGSGIGAQVVGFYNADRPAAVFDGVTFYATGGTGAASAKCVVSVLFADSIVLRNCAFPGAAADAYTVAFASIGAMDFEYANNDEGASLGLHSSASSAYFRRMDFSKHVLSSSGLKFPAVQVASSDPNTLDDYEEGSFAPTLTTTGTDFTSVLNRSERSGRYVKIGRLVFVQIRFESATVTVGAATGNLAIGGLPFAAQADDGVTGQRQGYGAFAVSDVAGWTNGPFSAAIISGESRIRLFRRTAFTGNETACVVGDEASSGNSNNITISGCYLVAN